MNTEILQRQFEKIGAELQINRLAEFRLSPTRYNRNPQDLRPEFDLNVVEGKRKDTFFLNIRPDMWNKLDFQVPHLDVPDRHLLLVSRQPAAPRVRKEKFLCGHDERHWFVAGLKDARVVTTREAKEFLKPESARFAQLASGVSAKNWHKRHNAGFVRQGEWFFIPRPDFQPDKKFLGFRNEPISRGAGSKSHIVEELVRSGGTTVYAHRYKNIILSEAEYFEKLGKDPGFKRHEYTARNMNPRVFVRGTVRHPDHYTITLRGWHEVIMNNEPASKFVAFLD
ncbi:MAG: hypothetical protein H6581_26410 [Bacteroidia bacterium]|nr:hypothetical protein [Bacteroidia bacterium]